MPFLLGTCSVFFLWHSRFGFWHFPTSLTLAEALMGSGCCLWAMVVGSRFFFFSLCLLSLPCGRLQTDSADLLQPKAGALRGQLLVQKSCTQLIKTVGWKSHCLGKMFLGEGGIRVLFEEEIGWEGLHKAEQKENFLSMAKECNCH